MPHSLSKKDDSVSSVIGTMMLLALVIVAGSIVAINVSSNISSSSEMGPITTLEVSADGKSIYNSGGDVLYRQNMYVYDNEGLVEDVYLIDEGYILHKIENYDWTEWKTGQAIRAVSSRVNPEDSAIVADDLCVVYFEGGKGFAIFTGSSYIGVVPTVKPTKQPTPSPTSTGSGQIIITLKVIGSGSDSVLDQFTVPNEDNLYSRIGTRTIYEGKMINGWFKDRDCTDDWNYLEDVATGSMTLYAEVVNEPYFKYGTKVTGEYGSITEFVAAVNNWKKGTIIVDSKGNYIISKDIPLEDKSLTFSFGSAEFGVSEYLINTPDEYNPTGTTAAIWASPNRVTGSLIDIKGGSSLKFIKGNSVEHISDNIVIDGCKVMGDSVINVDSGASLIADGNLEVKNGKSGDLSSTDNGGGIYNAGTITVNSGVTLTVSGNSATNGGGIYNAGTITVNSGGTLTVSGNSATNGGGIYNTGTISVTKSEESITGGKLIVSDNTATEKGGGIYNMGGSVAISGIIGSSSEPDGVYSNKAVSGGGIYNYGGKITLNSDGAVLYNLAETVSSGVTRNLGCGGGIFNTGTLEIYGSVNYNSANEIVDSLSPNNYEAMGGGIYNAFEDDSTYHTGHKYNINIYKDAKIIGNTASSRGGGILNSHNYDESTKSGLITINGAVISGNTAASGGGIHNFDSNGKIEIISSTISNNEVNYWDGGGIYNAGTLSISGTSTISGNKENGAGTGGGGIYNAVITSGDSSIPGKIYLTSDCVLAVSENFATKGGGIYNAGIFTFYDGSKLTVGKNKASADGGGIYNTGSDMSVSGTVSENTATNGGGIYNTGSSMSVSGTVSRNGNGDSDGKYKAINGGGIYNTGSSMSVSGTVSDNTATNGGGIHNTGESVAISGIIGSSSKPDGKDYSNMAKNGGGIYNTGSDMSVSGTVSYNTATSGSTATGDGGGIYNTNTGSMSVSGTVSHNTATNGNGGGIYNKGTLIIDGTDNDGVKSIKIESNTATNGKGGGIYIESESSTSIKDAGITSNQAKGGGGIYIQKGMAKIISCTITENKANYWGGGGILSKGELTIFGSESSITEISGNKVKPGQNGEGGGGIVIVDGGTATLSGYVTISGNIANVKSYGDTITFDTSDKKGFGGGIYVRNGELRVSGSENIITNNIGIKGGGIYTTNEIINDIKYEGTVNIGYNGKSGKLSVNSNGVYNSEIKTKDGGGIYNKGTFTVNEDSELTVYYNKASNNGGGIYNTGTFTNNGGYTLAEDANIEISNNNANSGGGIYNTGTISNTREGILINHRYGKIKMVHNEKLSTDGKGSAIYNDGGDIIRWDSVGDVDNIYGTYNTAPAYYDKTNGNTQPKFIDLGYK